MMELLCARLLEKGVLEFALTFKLPDEKPDLERLYVSARFASPFVF